MRGLDGTPGGAASAAGTSGARPTRLLTLSAIWLMAISGAGPAAPLVLYDPTTPAAPDLSAHTLAPQPCGLTTPCTDLNTAAQAHIAAPFGGNFEYGMSGEASAGVSNHGQGGELGVLGWVRSGDTTVSLGLSVGASRFGGTRGVVLPPPRP